LIFLNSSADDALTSITVYYDEFVTKSVQMEKINDENGIEKPCMNLDVQMFNSTHEPHFFLNLKCIMKSEQHTLEFYNFMHKTLQDLWSRGFYIKIIT